MSQRGCRLAAVHVGSCNASPADTLCWRCAHLQASTPRPLLCTLCACRHAGTHAPPPLTATALPAMLSTAQTAAPAACRGALSPTLWCNCASSCRYGPRHHDFALDHSWSLQQARLSINMDADGIVALALCEQRAPGAGGWRCPVSADMLMPRPCPEGAARRRHCTHLHVPRRGHCVGCQVTKNLNSAAFFLSQVRAGPPSLRLATEPTEQLPLRLVSGPPSRFEFEDGGWWNGRDEGEAIMVGRATGGGSALHAAACCSSALLQ